MLERIILLGEGEEIQEKDVLPFLETHTKGPDMNDMALNVSLPEQGMDMENFIGNMEKSLLTQALQKTGGSKKQAADLLHLSLRTFRYRLQKYHLDDSF